MHSREKGPCWASDSHLRILSFLSDLGGERLGFPWVWPFLTGGPDARVRLFQVSLNDSHNQMVVHWAGEKSNVIVALARDSLALARPKSSDVSICVALGTPWCRHCALSDPLGLACQKTVGN